MRFPDGTTHDACAPASDEGVQLGFSDEFSCRVTVGYARGNGDEARWEVGGDLVSGDSEWFATTGRHELILFYAPNALPSSRCPPGYPSTNCPFYRPGCQFEITRAAHALGDVVEGHLVAPCTLPSPSATDSSWTPVVESMRFRAHLSARDVNDMGATCGYPCTGPFCR